MPLIWTNPGDAYRLIKEREEKLKNAGKIAKQMGILAENEIHPLTHKKSGTWDGTIHTEVREISSFKWEIWVGSKGAFSGSGYNYGKRQEDLYHPIDIGWHKAWPSMIDLWNRLFEGVETVNSAGMSDFSGLDVSDW